MVEVIIDKPLLKPQELGFNDGTIPSSLFTNERYLPNILVQIGFFKSKGEIRKNRPDLVITLDKLDMLEFKIGKKIVWILVGLTDEDYVKYELEEAKHLD